MKIGILGSGDVAKSLAAGFLSHGHEAMLGTRDRAKLEGWVAQNPKGAVGSFADAARFGELLVLAVKGTVAAEALRAAGIVNVAGKPVIDTTNPIADAPPANGVLRFFTNLDESLMERLQREFESVRFVKAFNSVGNACMVDPRFTGGKPTMFICGNDPAAKKTVSVFTYSPSVSGRKSKFPAALPAYKTDSYNQFTANFPNTFGGPEREITQITSPLDGSHVPRIFPLSAAAHGPDRTSHMQIYVDGTKYADYRNVNSLPTGTKVVLPRAGVHRVAVQTHDSSTGNWVKSVIYVISP